MTKRDYVLVFFGFILGILSIIMSLKVDLHKLPNLPDGTFIATVVLAIATIALVKITADYAKSTESMLNEQRKSIRKDRLIKEMDLLVAPLYIKIGDNIIFQKGAQSNIDSQRPRDKEYLKFWDEVKRNKYLAPDYLRSAINNYLKNKSNTVDDKERDESYIIAEDKLFKEIEKRYNELEKELSTLD